MLLNTRLAGAGNVRVRLAWTALLPFGAAGQALDCSRNVAVCAARESVRPAMVALGIVGSVVPGTVNWKSSMGSRNSTTCCRNESGVVEAFPPLKM